MDQVTLDKNPLPRHEFSTPALVPDTGLTGSYADTATDYHVTVRSALCGCANLATATGRRNNALLILTIAIIPVVVLIMQNAYNVIQDQTSLGAMQQVKGGRAFQY